MAQFHRHDVALNHEGRTETSPKTQEEQGSALITAQGLHGRIIDDFHGSPECAFEIKPDPPAPQVMRLDSRLAPEYRAGVANRYRIIFPVSCELLHAGNHLFRGHLRPGRKSSRLGLPGGKYLDMGSPNINGQHLHDGTSFPVEAIL